LFSRKNFELASLVAFLSYSKGRQKLIFSLVLEDKSKHSIPIQNVAILPFNKHCLWWVENWVSKNENIHALLGRFNVEHRFQCLLKLLYGNKEEQSGRISNKFQTLKRLWENQENLPCIFYYDAKSHPDLGSIYHMKPNLMHMCQALAIQWFHGQVTILV
jgi:hypothetical protein